MLKENSSLELEKTKHMKDLTKILLLCVSAFFCGNTLTAETKPNIVYINVDYQGSAYYETPHIDKLSTQGMTFTNGYAAANCAPI